MISRILLLVLLVATLALLRSENVPPNNGLPLVHASFQAPAPQMMLFAPCPADQRNFPRANLERKA